MKGIYVNTDILESKIQKLENLMIRCSQIDVVAWPVEGSGKVIDAIGEVDKGYAVVKDNLYLLVSNSVILLKNARQNIMEADCLAASEISTRSDSR